MEKNEDPVAALKAQAKKQKLKATVIKVLVIVFMLISVIVCLAGLLLFSIMIGPGFFSEEPSYVGWVTLIMTYCSFFVIPFLLCLPFILPFAVRNKNVNRIIVFRKFNNSASGKALKKIIGSSIGFYGHVFTLSDSRFKIKWYVRIPVLLGQMSFFHFRSRTISKEKHLLKLQQELDNKGWLNVNWLLSGSKIFAVKTTDEYWQQTAKLLLAESRLVVFDVSDLTASIEWETETTKALDLEKNIIVIASENSRAVALRWKAKYDKPDDHEIPLFFYDEQGKLTDGSSFENSLLNVLAGYNTVNTTTFRKSILTKLLQTTAAFAVTFTLILFFLSPYLFPSLTAKHSPFAGQATRAYIHLRLTGDFDEDYKMTAERIKSSWPEKTASLLVKYAYDHEVAECDAVVDALADLADISQKEEYIKLVEKGEPNISETAFQILCSLSPKDSNMLGLRFLAAQRIDVNEKAIRLLENRKQNVAFAADFLKALSSKSDTIEKEPEQHETKNMFEGLKVFFAWTKKDFPEKQTMFYMDIYRLLVEYNSTLRKEQLIAAYKSASSSKIKMMLALQLINERDATGIESLYSADFISGFYEEGMIERSVDSAFGSNKKFDHLPPLRLVIPGEGTFSEQLPKPMILFILRNYANEDLRSLDASVSKESLTEDLYGILKNDSLRDNSVYLKLITTNQKKFREVMQNGEVKLGLMSAWLLACIGDPEAAVFAAEAGRIKKPFIGNSYTLPYATEAIDILETLEKNLKEPFDTKALAALNTHLPYDIEILVNSIVYKSGRLKAKAGLASAL